jgi:hypothetical protein
MHNKTHRNCKKSRKKCFKNAKKATSMKYRLQTCRAKKYQSVYGSDPQGMIRSLRHLFF